MFFMDFFCKAEPSAASLSKLCEQGDKKALRRALLERRKALASGEKGVERSLRVQRRLLESVFWKRSSRVTLYMAVRGEVDTELLLAEAWRSGREVFLPRCRSGEPGLMDMVACSGPEELERSGLGLLEPRLTESSRLLSEAELSAGERTLVVVPALAFDAEGYRLGYGGGYYDRLLARGTCAVVGLTYHDLLFPRLPREAWDRPVHAVCTEEEMCCFRP